MGKGQRVRDDLNLVHCSRCGQWKPREEFNIRNTRLNLLQYVCRECQSEQGRNRYLNHKDHVREVNKVARVMAKERNRTYVYSILQESHCADCGITDARVLTFDHVRGKKRWDIATMIGNGLAIETIQAEMDKCDVVCHNCHAIRTQKRSGHFKGWLPFLRKKD